MRAAHVLKGSVRIYCVCFLVLSHIHCNPEVIWTFPEEPYVLTQISKIVGPDVRHWLYPSSSLEQSLRNDWFSPCVNTAVDSPENSQQASGLVDDISIMLLALDNHSRPAKPHCFECQTLFSGHCPEFICDTGFRKHTVETLCQTSFFRRRKKKRLPVASKCFSTEDSMQRSTCSYWPTVRHHHW